MIRLSLAEITSHVLFLSLFSSHSVTFTRITHKNVVYSPRPNQRHNLSRCENREENYPAITTEKGCMWPPLSLNKEMPNILTRACPTGQFPRPCNRGGNTIKHTRIGPAITLNAISPKQVSYKCHWSKYILDLRGSSGIWNNMSHIEKSRRNGCRCIANEAEGLSITAIDVLRGKVPKANGLACPDQ